jgi:hypothetical protein
MVGGKQVFNIDGGGYSSLVGYNFTIKNASSLGTLTNLPVVLFDILQILNCDDGFDISNIHSFYLDKTYWTNGNTGTYLTLSGSFTNLQISGGRVVSDIGEIGIDVSANPAIDVSASMSKVDFSGEGTSVVPYTNGDIYLGYNFSNRWDVDCPGIPLETDDNANGDINLDAEVGSGFVTTFNIIGNGAPKKLVGTSTSNNLFRFTASSDNRIVYKGSKKRFFQIVGSLSFQGDLNSAIFIFYIARNGVVLPNTKVYREVGENNDVGALAVVGAVEMEPNDYIEIWVQRNTGAGNLMTVSLNVSAK